MSEPFLGQISMVAFTFAPRGWALCNGQLLPINQNQALFALLGTFYGGDGRVTFALPDLRGRIPLHAGTGAGLSPRALGERGGAESHTLTTAEMPAHTHAVAARLRGETGAATVTSPTGGVLASGAAVYRANTPADDVNMDPAMITVTQQNAGGGQSFGIVGPYLALNFVIALQGVFPSRD